MPVGFTRVFGFGSKKLDPMASLASVWVTADVLSSSASFATNASCADFALVNVEFLALPPFILDWLVVFFFFGVLIVLGLWHLEL